MSLRKTHKQFVNELNNKNPYISCIDTYIDARTKIYFKCKKCGHVFLTTPDSVLRGSGCGQCAGILKKSTKEFKKEIAEINENIEIKGKYINNRTPILCKCKRCNKEWKQKPSELLSGTGCPNCYHRSTSFVEQCIYETFGIIYGFDSVTSRNTTLIGKELDIVVQKEKIAVEFGSWFWHKTKLANDIEKISLCNDKGFRLLVIYDSFDDVSLQNKNILTISNNLSRDYKGIISLLSDILKWFNIEYKITPKTFNTIRKKAYENSSRKNTEDFKDELSCINSNIQIVGTYTTAKVPIECECIVCGYEWSSTPDNLLRGQGCPNCGKEQMIRKLTMTYEEFLAKNQKKLNKNVEIIGEYTNTNTKVKCKCKKCNYIWKASPAHLKNGGGCPKCAGKMKKTDVDFKYEVLRKNPGVEILGKYKNSKTPILTRCKKCGYEWKTLPTILLSKHGCPKCANNLKNKISDMQKELDKKMFNIDIIGEYTNTNTPLTFQCRICNHKWNQVFRNLLKSRGCPSCFPYSKKQDEKWNYFYKLAESYYHEHGNLKIPARKIYNKEKLGRWVFAQRRCYRNSLLPKEKQDASIGFISLHRIDLLNRIKMIW